MILTNLRHNYCSPPPQFTTLSPPPLNPEAPEYYPSPPAFLFSPPPIFYPPHPTAVINTCIIHRRHQLFPYFRPLKPIYHEVDSNPMLSAPPTEDLGPTQETESGSTQVTRKVQIIVPRKTSRVTGQGTSCVWMRKEVLNHPLAVSCNYRFGDSTSLMIRNIPVRFSRTELMELLEEHCRLENQKVSANDDDDEPASEFDFLYLPVDFERKGNLGYAFVNFTSWQGALRLYSSWNGKEWENCPYRTKKIRQIGRAKHQGKEEFRKHFEKSTFVCDTDEYLPVKFSPPRNGVNGDQSKLRTIGRRKWGV